MFEFSRIQHSNSRRNQHTTQRCHWNRGNAGTEKDNTAKDLLLVSPLYNKTVTDTLTVTLIPQSSARHQIDLLATNTLTGHTEHLKTLPLGLLPADTSRITVSPEAQLKNKTIYRVDLVRWKGLFSLSDDGTIEFRDELYLEPAQ